MTLFSDKEMEEMLEEAREWAKKHKEDKGKSTREAASRPKEHAVRPEEGKARRCDCGAKHTSNKTWHMTWCTIYDNSKPKSPKGA